jgi:hypothetical protein
MWKSSAAGWVQVALGYTLDFTSGGPYVIKEGDVITGATSGKTATVMRVVTSSGSWSTGSAVGYVVVASASGAFVARTSTSAPTSTSLRLTADKVAITLPPNGRYELLNHNFYGTANTLRMYGVNGVGRAFEFDGTTFTPIRSGMAVDTPHRIAEHMNHLFLAFPGGAFQNSSIGAPLDWSAVTGAAAYGMGDEITDLIPANAGVLTILAENKIANLYGRQRARLPGHRPQRRIRGAAVDRRPHRRADLHGQSRSALALGNAGLWQLQHRHPVRAGPAAASGPEAPGIDAGRVGAGAQEEPLPIDLSQQQGACASASPRRTSKCCRSIGASRHLHRLV